MAKNASQFLADELSGSRLSARLERFRQNSSLNKGKTVY
jgi:hypothetical protein